LSNQEKDAEIERLKEALEDLSDHGCAAERFDYIKAQSAEIGRLKTLLTRAADALGSPSWKDKAELIAELRKAARVNEPMA
jgi:hypothetical protein